MTIDSISITFMSGPQDGLQMQFSLPDSGGKLTLTIGRNEDCDIAIPYDSQVSRLHARLVYTGADETVSDEELLPGMVLRLEDVGSRNGTYVGKQRLKGEHVMLPPGQLFRVGRTWLRVDP